MSKITMLSLFSSAVLFVSAFGNCGCQTYSASRSLSQLEKVQVFDIRDNPIKTPHGDIIGLTINFKVRFPKGAPVYQNHWYWLVEELPSQHVTMETINPRISLLGGEGYPDGAAFKPGSVYEVSGTVNPTCLDSGFNALLNGNPVTGTKMFWFSESHRAAVLADTKPHALQLRVGGRTFQTVGTYTLRGFYESGLHNGIIDAGK
jgi:hypothetical protein